MLLSFLLMLGGRVQANLAQILLLFEFASYFIIDAALIHQTSKWCDAQAGQRDCFP